MNPLLIATDGLIGGEFTSLEIASRGYLSVAVVVIIDVDIPLEFMGGRAPTEKWKLEIKRRELIYKDDEEVIMLVVFIITSGVLD